LCYENPKKKRLKYPMTEDMMGSKGFSGIFPASCIATMAKFMIRLNALKKINVSHFFFAVNPKHTAKRPTDHQHVVAGTKI